MIDPIQTALRIASSGLEAQSTRLRVVTENLANANSTGRTAGADPYRRKTITFNAEVDRASGGRTVAVGASSASPQSGVEPTPSRAPQGEGREKLAAVGQATFST